MPHPRRCHPERAQRVEGPASRSIRNFHFASRLRTNIPPVASAATFFCIRSRAKDLSGPSRAFAVTIKPRCSPFRSDFSDTPPSTPLRRPDWFRLVAAPGGASQSQTDHVIQELFLQSRQLDGGAASGGEGGTSCRRVVPAHRVHRDQSGDAEPSGGAVLQQAGHCRAVDQGGQVGGEDDAAELPPVPVERGAAVTERDRIQLGQPVASAGAAEGNRNVVVDQLAAAAGEDRRPVGQAFPLLLAVLGREPSDAAPVRKHAAADSGFAAAGRIGAAATRNQSGRRRGVEGGVSVKWIPNQARHVFLAWAEDLRGRQGLRRWNECEKGSEPGTRGYILRWLGKQNGNSG